MLAVHGGLAGAVRNRDGACTLSGVAHPAISIKRPTPPGRGQTPTWRMEASEWMV